MVSLQEQYEEGIFDPVPDEDGGVLAAPDGGVPDGEESDKGIVYTNVKINHIPSNFPNSLALCCIK